jgi:membrane-associated phospholipid phosphatase
VTGTGDAIRRRLDPEARYGLRLTLLAVAFLLVAVPFGWLLSQVQHHGTLVRLDTAAARDLHGWVRGSPHLVTALKVLTFFGSPPWLWLLVAAAVVVTWRSHHIRLCVFLAVTTVGGGLLDSVVKVAVDRPRPSLVDPVATAHGKSFPSGHAMSSTIVYGALLMVFLPVLARRLRPAVVTIAATLVVAIGFSRLALGVHYISDVVGGYVLGLAWLVASVAAFSTWRVERGRAPVEPMAGLEPEAAADLV